MLEVCAGGGEEVERRTFVFVQDTQADSPRRIDVGMEERWDEFAFWGFGRVLCPSHCQHLQHQHLSFPPRTRICPRSAKVKKRLFRTIGKRNSNLEKSSLPRCLLLARHAAFPHLEVEGAFGVLDGFGEEAEGVVFAPLFAVRMAVLVRYLSFHESDA